MTDRPGFPRGGGLRPAPFPALFLLVLLTGMVALSACGGSATRSTSPSTTSTSTAPITSSSTTTAAGSLPAESASPIVSLTRPLGSAIYDPETAVPVTLAPVTISIEAISVDEAPVVDVGVLPNGEMEIPGGDEVGWYRFGPSPGDDGSAVLAAHIAYEGRNGVFRRLAELEPGGRFEIGYADGSLRVFEVTERVRYAKAELPFDRVFAKTGESTVALITCGGDFNRSLRSYEDNVVVYAVPVDSGSL